MNKQEDFFSSNHKRLLNVATWAKYMAWIVLGIFIIQGFVRYFRVQINQTLYGVIPEHYADFITLLKMNPLFAASLFIEILSIFLQGIVYFLVLNGISLGLNMIVETNINYREQKEGAE
jgi:hypothetical protein